MGPAPDGPKEPIGRAVVNHKTAHYRVGGMVGEPIKSSENLIFCPSITGQFNDMGRYPTVSWDIAHPIFHGFMADCG
jgi:hypothetical protein